ncbi:protein of unknown function [Myxococcus virescens]|uniref:Protein NO VEIN C-terminal domain-containing protein n=1 Tax=Myxococcus virescens TaxID=83456 RepID=A0ABY0NFD3_9BACT|nr:protein of unknown function [Myxococcus virescens]
MFEGEVPAALRELWRQRAHLLASNVATHGREHREIAHAAALIRQDYHDRFLVELLQNANDQALRGEVHDSTVVVVRSERLLAVSNGGQVLTPQNLERISSLADSDKTGMLVGNKGVGFKAVYQVTGAPEFYSAAEAEASGASGDVFTDFGIGIALEQEPFQQQALVAAVEDDIRTFFTENAGLARSLAERGFEEPMDAVRPELARVAGFKFPLARTRDALLERLAELRIPEPAQRLIRTLVVLPLRDQRAADDVAQAIDRLVGAGNGEPGQAELAVLFLTGVSTVIVLDHVRDLRWTFTRTIAGAPGSLAEATVSVVEPGGVVRSTHFWLLQRDALAGAAPVAAERRRLVTDALSDFGLETWTEDDPLPVTIALPMPRGERPAPLGPAGRFCLGLPTQQPTGLPVHVDARFFATISRTGLDFALPYNALLLEVAAELVGELLIRLRASNRIEERRAATLALQRSPGALAKRVFEPGGVADADVVLTWGGERFARRGECRLPGKNERTLLPFLRDVLPGVPDLLKRLPDEGLLIEVADVLASIDLPKLESRPHPWLERTPKMMSAVELAARRHRNEGPSYWEGFAIALLECFDAADLQEQAWLPVGSTELAAPAQRVFLPAPVDPQGDEEEVANVPSRVAAMIRLLDSGAMRLREDGRALTKLALRLADQRLVRRPRKTELLEEALFPALVKASVNDSELALELFGQAVAWIASMREVSRRKLDCSLARVPVIATTGGGVSWAEANKCYLGEGWGLSRDHDRLLEQAYPGRRLLPLRVLRERFGLAEEALASWRGAVELMGVKAVPRVVVFPNRSAPLESLNRRLYVVGNPTLGKPELDAVYRVYVEYLATHPTRWMHRLPHDVNQVCWIDGLEVAERRQPIVDLMLMHPDVYLRHHSVSLGRVGTHVVDPVASMWVVALACLDWAVFPGERGVGREPVRVPAGQLWRLPDGARRAGYAQVLNVVPHNLAAASSLLRVLGVPSVEDAPLARLFGALGELALRLDKERLHTRREALSLAIELYARIDERLEHEPAQRVPPHITVPLLRDRRLEAVKPIDEGVLVVFDDEPSRARHVVGLDRAFRVPVARDATVDRLYALFARSWGTGWVLRTSTAKVALEFTPSPGDAERFLSWLQREYPHSEVAAELAALLTFGGERSIRSEPVSRNWKAFERLTVVFGSFRDPRVVSFYDRAADKLLVSSTLEKHDVVAMTWELVGARSRDLWAGYAHALRDGSTRSFLREREITDVEIVDVADAAGLHRSMSVDGLAPALLAARCHMVPGTSLEDAAAWFASVGDRPEDVARALERPDLTAVLTAALEQRAPEGEIQVVRYLGVPWPLWQDAVLRRDGKRYAFVESELRYRRAREHVVAVAREIGAREASVDLALLGTAISDALASPTPDDVRFLPVETAAPDDAAWRAVRLAVSSFDVVVRALEELPPPPWDSELPTPRDATQRGVRLYRDVAATTREIDATTSVKAVVQVAVRLAASFNEQVDGASVLADAPFNARMSGEWAHVYSALLLLRPLLEATAPETVKKLSSVHAFREPTTESSLMAKLPEIPRTEPEAPQPKQSVLGVELTAVELRADLASGADGVLGGKLAEAAARGLDPVILSGVRPQLPPPNGSGTSGGGGGSGGSTSRPRREPELVGDIGEALVHEWLASVLGADYGPDCWVSKARERYGFPASGNDGLGYDFKVPDPKGRLFGKPAAAFLLEVKSTSTDGSGPFPMSRAEWDQARQCHEEGGDTIYIILRVFEADSNPRIGDVVMDPFAAHRRGEIRLAERDLWVTVATPSGGRTDATRREHSV